MSELFLKKEDFEKVFKNHLKIETYSKRIESLYSDRLLRKINYKPYYQRNYVWDKHKASYFIESILIGTEIPPLIFFNNGKTIEVIDGRQRFETVKKFRNNDFSLTKKGLSALKKLANNNYSSLINEFSEIGEIFLDAKLRIIEFEIVNKSDLDPLLEDKIKKEIFARYNSGITPLKRPEIDNAIYDKEAISTHFKSKLKKDPSQLKLIHSLFFKNNKSLKNDPPIDIIMQFIRRYLVLHRFPMKYFARGTARTELLTKYFDYLSDTYDDIDELYEKFLYKIGIVKSIKSKISESRISQNHLVFECLLWAIFIIENEEIDLAEITKANLINKLIHYISENIDKYPEQDHHYYNEIMERYTTTAKFFSDVFNINLNIYIDGNDSSKEEMKTIRKRRTGISNIEEFESMRLTKPDPSRTSIDDILTVMKRNRFLIRPSYQRSEVINLPKASAIIESILLGVMLPAIFIYKRQDGVSEVIDGQQRLLTILGFLGKEYIDDDGNIKLSKNQKFKLRDLRILNELKSSNFDDLSDDLQDKIWDFELFVVEIEERLNPEFNPIDLFIRLNDKPYPIRENSFEMWNSWVDKDIISKIKEHVKIPLDWFYIKSKKQLDYRDRMENEELYTLLVYLEYRRLYGKDKKEYLDIYQKGDRINARVRDKKDVTNVLGNITEDTNEKPNFLKSINNIDHLIRNLKLILLSGKEYAQDINAFLSNELDLIFKAGKSTRSYRRTLQDFYILWELIYDIEISKDTTEIINVKKEIKHIFKIMKNIGDSELEDNRGYKIFNKTINEFKNKYKPKNL